MIDDDQMRALRQHFSAGAGQANGSVTTDTAGSPPPVILNVLKLKLPALDYGPVIATDGSVDNHPRGGSTVIGAGAAVAADGRMQIGWYETLPSASASLYAEWQAARLGLRLAGRYPDEVTLITDQQTVAEQIRRAVTGKPLHGVITKEADRDTTGEIIGLARCRKITVACRSGTASKPGRTAVTPLGRVAHAGAWLVRRLVAEGFDPREHVPWLTGALTNPASDKAALRRKYLRYVCNQAEPGWQRDLHLRDLYL